MPSLKEAYDTTIFTAVFKEQATEQALSGRRDSAPFFDFVFNYTPELAGKVQGR